MDKHQSEIIDFCILAPHCFARTINMIPQKLNFVEQKNTKNTIFSEKSVENSKKIDKNTQFLGETPLILQRGPRDTSSRSLPLYDTINKSIYRLENTITRVFHHEIPALFTTEMDMRNVTYNPRAYAT